MFSLWVFAQRAIWFRFDSIRAFSEEKSLNPQNPCEKTHHRKSQECFLADRSP